MLHCSDLLQSCPLPSISSFHLLDFTFDDESIGDQDTLLSTLAMVIDLKLHEHFNVEYQVHIHGVTSKST